MTLTDSVVEAACRAWWENDPSHMADMIGRPSWADMSREKPDTADRRRDDMRAALEAAIAPREKTCVPAEKTVLG